MIIKVIKLIVLSMACSLPIYPFFDPNSVHCGEIQAEFDDIPKFIVKKSVEQAWDNKEKITKQIAEDCIFQEEMLVPDLKIHYIAFNQKRKDALQEIQTNGNVYFKQTYYIHAKPVDYYLFDSCPDLHVGNSLMQIVHIELLQVSTELDRVTNCNFLLYRVNEFAKLAIKYNRLGHIDKAMLLADLCWAVLDAVVAIKIRLIKGSAQKCIVKQFLKIISMCGLTPKTNNKLSDFEYLQTISKLAEEKLQAMPARSLVQTEVNLCPNKIFNPYPHEDYLMHKLLEEVRLWCINTMQYVKTSAAAKEVKKHWWFW